MIGKACKDIGIILIESEIDFLRCIDDTDHQLMRKDRHDEKRSGLFHFRKMLRSFIGSDIIHHHYFFCLADNGTDRQFVAGKYCFNFLFINVPLRHQTAFVERSFRWNNLQPDTCCLNDFCRHLRRRFRKVLKIENLVDQAAEIMQ